MLMEQKFEGIFAEVVARSKQVEAVLAGNTNENVPKGLEGAFSGPVIDENEDSQIEVQHLRLLLEKHLGSSLEEASIVATLESEDKATRVEIFGAALGGNSYFLSRWQNEGEKPSYVLWPKEMYDVQLIGDEEMEVPAPFSIVEGGWE